MKPELLQLVRCPETHQKLALAEPGLISRLNSLIPQQALKNRAGQVIQESFEAGLVREDRKYLYPVRKDIPVLLVDQAIPLEAFEASSLSSR